MNALLLEALSANLESPTCQISQRHSPCVGNFPTCLNSSRLCQLVCLPMLFLTRALHLLAVALCACGIAVALAILFQDVESERSTSLVSSSPKLALAPDDQLTLEELKSTGLQRSRFKDFTGENIDSTEVEDAPEADLAGFENSIKPLLNQYCIDCHSKEYAEGNIALDSLDPDLLRGKDTEWWEEVFAVVTKEEMPPPDEVEINGEDRQVIVDWLSDEFQAASILRSRSGSHSSFRRLTRYEYNYALQDLLGLPWDFAKDLPPDPQSEEGFRNSSELLHLSVSQFETSYRLAREALSRATVSGEKPETLYWGITMRAAAEREFPKQNAKIEQAKKDLADKPEELEAKLSQLDQEFRRVYRNAYYKDLNSGRTAPVEWVYHGARYAFAPTKSKPEFPSEIDCVAVLPAGRNQEMILELGNQLPDEGTLRVTVRASRVNSDDANDPSLSLLFGWQASNEGRALLRVSKEDVPVTASPEQPQLIQWEIPLGEIYPRNSVRKTSAMGAMPSPSEYIRIANSSASSAEVQIDYVLIETPVYDQWPPESHQRIFFESENSNNELLYASEIIQDFMRRAWRRMPSQSEVERKIELYQQVRTESDSFEEAVLEVLATVLSSPQFLYVARSSGETQTTATTVENQANADPYELATRLALFLWSSVPDEELHRLAASGELTNEEVLTSQIERMLGDSRADRLSEQFVNQWLNMELLEFVNFAGKVQQFDPLLKESMQREPISMFEEVLKQNSSVLDFIHSDYAMVDERLAKHYGLKDVHGNHFRRVKLEGDFRRGGLLTQAGLLAMNSDWPDSHPLKRAIWLLECLLADPPPPPPPAVPQIDLADPEIAKMTLKERIEDHRNHAACKSCHTKIDPWGIAFENYDALGNWRDEIRGKPVDASSELFNRQTLDGMEGLKRYLLESRQDQFVQAMVEKLATYALGRPLRFEDRSEIESITAKVRNQGDGLRTIIREIVQSDLFIAP